MDRGRRVKVSKLLSFGLRHDPAALGLVLDANGWVAVGDVLAGLAKHGEEVTRADLEEVVATSDKQRFALSEDKARIRANQGHSVDVDLGLAPSVPPELLFHGTSAKVEDAIRREGLRAGERTHVHLSVDEETARRVGARRGEPCVLRVDSGAMAREGFTFHRSDNGVWLTDAVPRRFLTGAPADPRR